MAEAVEPRARAYIYAHKNRSWEKRDKLRRRHAARTVRCAAIEERRAAAFHADVQRVPELRFSASQEDFRVFQ